jgi:hypothetical protein
MSYIDVMKLADRNDVQHNAWLQDFLDMHWSYILSDYFVGRYQTQLEDRARSGIYHLLDWIATRPRSAKTLWFTSDQIKEEACNPSYAVQRTPIIISDDLDIVKDVVETLLTVLVSGKYLQQKGDSYRVVWDTKTRSPRKVRSSDIKKVQPVGEAQGQTQVLPPQDAVSAAPDASPVSTNDTIKVPSNPTSKLPDSQNDNLTREVAKESDISDVTQDGSEHLHRDSPQPVRFHNHQSNITHPLRVFLCHSSADKPAVRDLYRRLRAEGIVPWFDEKDLVPGQLWRVEIPKAVRATDVVLVCLSRHSVDRAGYAQKEIKLALDVADEQPEGSIFVIPVRLEEYNIPERLSDLHWVDLFEERGYERLIRALQHRATRLGRELALIPHVPPTSADVE